MREQVWQRFRSSRRQRGGRRRAAPAAAAVAADVMVMGALAPPAAFAAARPDTVQQGLNALVRSDGVPAALASVKGREGRTLTYTAGVGDLATGSKVPRDGQMRIGSNTKIHHGDRAATGQSGEDRPRCPGRNLSAGPRTRGGPGGVIVSWRISRRGVPYRPWVAVLGSGGSGRGRPGRPSMLVAMWSFFWKYASSDSSVSRAKRDACSGRSSS